jgi:hypothetical protein
MEILKTLKDKVMGTDEQNKAASERMKDNPMEKKFQKMMGNEPKDEKEDKPVKKMAKGGMIKSSASKRADGCAIKGKTKGRMV